MTTSTLEVFTETRQIGDATLQPVVWTVHTSGGSTTAFPLGAYVVKDDKVRFVPAFDFVGLAAVLFVAAPAAYFGIKYGTRLGERVAQTALRRR